MSRTTNARTIAGAALLAAALAVLLLQLAPGRDPVDRGIADDHAVEAVSAATVPAEGR